MDRKEEQIYNEVIISAAAVVEACLRDMTKNEDERDFYSCRSFLNKVVPVNEEYLDDNLLNKFEERVKLYMGKLENEEE